jgi:hypothetical protein
VTDQRRIAASGKYRMAPSDLEYVKNFEAFIGHPPYPTKVMWLIGSLVSRFPGRLRQRNVGGSSIFVVASMTMLAKYSARSRAREGIGAIAPVGVR